MQTLTFSMSLHDIPSKKGIHKILVFCLKKSTKLFALNAYFIPELRVKFYFYFFRVWSQWPIAQWLTQLANSPVSDSMSSVYDCLSYCGPTDVIGCAIPIRYIECRHLSMVRWCRSAACAEESDPMSTQSSVNIWNSVAHLEMPIIRHVSLERHITTEPRI